MRQKPKVVIHRDGWYHLNKLEKICRRSSTTVNQLVNALLEHGPEPAFPCPCPQGDKNYAHFFHPLRDGTTPGRDAYSALVKRRLHKKSRSMVRRVRAVLSAHLERLRKTGEPEEYDEYNSLYTAIFS